YLINQGIELRKKILVFCCRKMQLIDYIRLNGLCEEGVLRISGSCQRVQGLSNELQKLYASNCRCSQTMESLLSQLLSGYSIFDCIAVFKQFIRMLPQPILSFRLLDAFLA